MSNIESDEHKEMSPKKALQEIFIKVIVRCIEEIRNELKIDENFFLNSTALKEHPYPKDFFIYSLLDQLLKNFCSDERMIDGLFDEKGELSKLKELNNRPFLTRAWLESMNDELNFRKRKLLEIFVHLINFKTTNEDVYFKYYLNLLKIKFHSRIDCDNKEFYKCDNKNNQHSLNNLKKYVDALPVDLNKCWFLKNDVKLIKSKYKVSNFEDTSK